MKKLCFILLLMSLGSIQCDAQAIFFRGNTNTDTITVGQPFDYQLFLTIPKDYYVEWQQLGDTLSKSIDVINVGEVTTKPVSNSDNIMMTRHLTLTSFDTGYVYVPEIVITYSKDIRDSIRQRLHTNEHEIYVTTVAVDTTQTFRPIKGVIKQGITAKETLPWAAVVIALAFLAYFIFTYNDRVQKKEIVVEENKKPSIPAIVTARAKLNKIKINELWNSGKTKDYYTDLTDIAREYLEGQFEIDAVEMTTDEIMEAVNKLNLNTLTKTKLQETLTTADFVKFAKANPTTEQNKKSFSDINNFVEDSYIFFQEEEKKKEEMK